jgi:hypothetical protein
MKRLHAFAFVLAALLTFGFSVANAAVGTPVAIGSVYSSAATTYYVSTTNTTDVPAGSELCALTTTRSAGQVTAVSDSAQPSSNTYTARGSRAPVVSTSLLDYCSLTVNIIPRTAGIATSSITSNVLLVGSVSLGTVEVGQNVAGGTLTQPCVITSNIAGSGAGSTWNVAGAGCSNQAAETMALAGLVTVTVNGAVNSATGLVLMTGANAGDLWGVGASGTSTAPTITTGTLGAANEILIGETQFGTTGTYTVDTTHGWAALLSIPMATNSFKIDYQVVAATTAVTDSPTLGTSSGWSINYDTFKNAPVAAHQNCSLMGVC